ncbi:hypothetical protein POREN0001_0811 [Porphyromonas endodontalis ATCC 35406]|uniref:Uncharacterized protein n=1 Tax=Porphyromonas endodontalis (strain ATCC 35406 / DSM 24491 / JCM 8526 / CCUG 16442 / BCRC 14492 / NCTC 13058 / HG 370) TaxID=553175 RepID=C3J9R1_POREA|nr:hypothetical protein POREN0001_0811 [Porphyromonas endodontalis ATCC 35406]
MTKETSTGYSLSGIEWYKKLPTLLEPIVSQREKTGDEPRRWANGLFF